MEKHTETFETEVNELLQLIVHSLYSHPEIFLRELISNSSDAIDKLRLEALTDKTLIDEGHEPLIRIDVDKEKRILTVSDNGIGMTLDEIKENIGRIAHSGTKEFVKMRKELESNPELIGQFGVGFYSAFMVADKIAIETRKAGTEQGVRWESDGKGTYTTEPCDRPQGHGTSVILTLKEPGEEEGELEDFTSEWVIRSGVKKYSDFIAYPIKMEVEREEPVGGDDGDKDAKRTEKVVKDETLNSQKALWRKPAKEVSEDEYNEFYRTLSGDFNEPLEIIHFKAEGMQEFSSVLYLPPSKPWNYDFDGVNQGLSLYVRRVMIMNDCEELIPPYLRFVKGMVDSDDLPLNVSREILQHNRQIVQIKKAITSKVLKTLADLCEKDREKYEKFWNNFGPTLKEGLVREPEKQDKLLPLCLFHSTNSDKLTTLDEYLERIKEGQPAIYYIAGESVEQVKHSPHLERLKEKEYEVLFLVDPVDEFVGPRLDKYKDDKPFQSIMASDLELDNEEEKEKKEQELKESQEKFSDLLTVIQETLKEDIKEVKLSSRLISSPVCLVSDSGSPTSQMEHFYRQMGQEPPKIQRVMEINPKHPLFDNMLALPQEKKKEWAEILYDQALISEGTRIKDPAAFSRRIADLMITAGK